ncbi:hypothetical protein [Micromonospora sp. LOL_023]
MSDTATQHAFDVGNRAYQRLLAIAPEHLDVAVWSPLARPTAPRPV